MVEQIRCPHCQSAEVVRKGVVRQKFAAVQVYLCKSCGRKFKTRDLSHKSYPPRVITSSISFYNLGHTLNETVKHINRQFKVKVSKSSVHGWLQEFADLCSYRRIRDEVLKKYPPDQLIVSREFIHHDLAYNFKYHRGKLDRLPPSFSGLASYLKGLEHGTPNYFEEDQRPSQMKIKLKIERDTRFNQACRMAALAISAKRANTERHPLVETFMLLNDTATVACETPVWLWEKNLNAGIFGHIDILQVRNDQVYILDYKPDAAHEVEQKVASQLYFYASGISFRTKIPLTQFRCAWFDDQVYYEFEPRGAHVSYHLTETNKAPM